MLLFLDRPTGDVPLTRDDPASFAPPDSFGPFRVLHQIGVGALGPVFRTYEPSRDRLVAVKVFRLDIVPEQAQSLARALGRSCDAGLFHPSIVEPLAAGVEGTVAWRAEEYVAAESLDVAVRHYAPATLENALPFVTQLAAAVDFARAAGVGHGALHLRDVFLTPEEARAGGFGVVEALDSVGIRAPVRRPYTAPERVAGGAWGTEADVFSLGAIAFELLTGKRPAGTGSQIGALQAQTAGAHAAAVRSVLARAMHHEPSRRYPAALEFASALEAASRGEHAEAVERVPMPAPRGRGPGKIAPAVQLPEPLVAQPTAPLTAPAWDAASLDGPAPSTPVRDVALEREEDERFFALAAAEAARAAEPPVFDDDALSELAIDRGTASGLPDGFDDLAGTRAGMSGRDETPPGLDRIESQVEPAPPSLREEVVTRFQASSAPERTGPGVFALGLMLLVGVLLGFGAGYTIWGRGGPMTPGASGEATATAGNIPPATQPPGGEAGKTWSEEPVTPKPDAPVVRATPPPAPKATKGRLVVSSEPAGGSVTVNGKWRGRTPLTLEALRFGRITVRVVAAGYQVERKEITLSADDPSRTLAFRLQKTPPPAAKSPTPPPSSAQARAVAYVGTLYVDSRPRGATIRLDGRTVGTTPARIPEVPVGSHVVRLELDNYRPWSVSTRVTSGAEARVTGSLERIR